MHEYSVQALTDYLSGLELYFNACTNEDFGVKESLVSQGGVYLNKSAAILGKAYGEIENLKAAGPAVVKKETTEEITEGDITEGSMEDASPDEGGLKEESVDTADSGPPVEEVKTKAQVLEEISRKVQAEMDEQDAAQSEAPIPDSPVSESPPVAEPREEVSLPETPKEVAGTKTPEKEETSQAPAAEPALPASDTAKVKTEAAPSIKVSDKKQENAEAPAEVKTEAGSEEPGEETSGEDKIEKLNQKIMERSKTGDLNKDTGEVSPGESETPQAKVPDKGTGSEKSPGSVATGDAAAENPKPAPDNKEVAVVPPGGAPEELKEEEAPVDDVKSWCQERYQAPAELKNCMEIRAVAKDKVDKLTNAFSGKTKEREVLDKCMSDWKEGGSYNYEMVISCTQFFCKQSNIEGCKDLSK